MKVFWEAIHMLGMFVLSPQGLRDEQTRL